MIGIEPNKGLDRISDLVEKGQIKPVINGPYSFDKIPELIQYLGEGRHLGKIVVEIGKKLVTNTGYSKYRQKC